MPSIAVTSVPSEPFADDERLKGGDGNESRLSEPRAPTALEIDLVSPALERREGVLSDAADA